MTTNNITAVLDSTQLIPEMKLHFGYILSLLNPDLQEEVLKILTEHPDTAMALYENILEKSNAVGKADTNEWNTIVEAEVKQLEAI